MSEGQGPRFRVQVKELLEGDRATLRKGPKIPWREQEKASSTGYWVFIAVAALQEAT